MQVFYLNSKIPKNNNGECLMMQKLTCEKLEIAQANTQNTFYLEKFNYWKQEKGCFKCKANQILGNDGGFSAKDVEYLIQIINNMDVTNNVTTVNNQCLDVNGDGYITYDQNNNNQCLADNIPKDNVCAIWLKVFLTP